MESMRTDRAANPEFAVVVRGYDRSQVDEYLGELLGWLSEAEHRIQATDEANESLRREIVQLRATAASLEERAGVPGPQSLSAFSERMGQLMQQAVAAADELRTQAEREANERRDAVGAEVERMLERAKAEAREILRRARGKERELEESIASLAARRSTAVEELGRLHHQLSELLARPEATPVPGMSGAPGTGLSSAAVEPAPTDETAALPEAQASDAERTVVLFDQSDPANVTQALPAVQPGLAGGPDPTIVQHPGAEGRSRRGEPR